MILKASKTKAYRFLNIFLLNIFKHLHFKYFMILKASKTKSTIDLPLIASLDLIWLLTVLNHFTESTLFY